MYNVIVIRTEESKEGQSAEAAINSFFGNQLPEKLITAISNKKNEKGYETVLFKCKPLSEKTAVDINFQFISNAKEHAGVLQSLTKDANAVLVVGEKKNLKPEQQQILKNKNLNIYQLDDFNQPRDLVSAIVHKTPALDTKTPVVKASTSSFFYPKEKKALPPQFHKKPSVKNFLEDLLGIDTSKNTIDGVEKFKNKL